MHKSSPLGCSAVYFLEEPTSLVPPRKAGMHEAGSFCGLVLTPTLTRRQSDHFTAKGLPAVVNLLIYDGGTNSVLCSPREATNGCRLGFIRLPSEPSRLVCHSAGTSLSDPLALLVLSKARILLQGKTYGYVLGKGLNPVLNGPSLVPFPVNGRG